MNPYQQLMMAHAAMGLQPAPAPTPTVDQQIGADKLAKHPYNPYGLIMPNGAATNPDAPVSKDAQFTQEMTKDTRE